MKVLLVNDIHLSDRPPSSCTETYTEDLLDLLRQTVEAAYRHKVSAVVWAGDVFHSKIPGRTSHRLVQRTIEIGQSYEVPWLIVPGNHDVLHDNLDSIHETQPLGVLMRAGARLLSGWAAPGVHFRDPDYLPLYGVPWQQTWDDEHVFGALKGYTQERSRLVLVVAHAPLYPPGLELPYEFYPAEQWALAMDGGKGSCWYGHVHESHEVWQCGDVTFANFGALSRGSLHEHNISRQIAVGIWDSYTGGFEKVPLQARPAEEVFRLREAREESDTRDRLEQFLTQVGSARLAVMSAEAVMEHVRGLALGKDVENEVADLLEWSAHHE